MLKSFGFKIIGLLSLLFFMQACQSDDNGNTPVTGDYRPGFWVITQGNFGQSNSGISFAPSNWESSLLNAFELANPGANLGDTGQDIAFHDDRAFVVMNNSATIQVLSRNDMKKLGEITQNLSNPRYVSFHNGRMYVTNWGDGTNPDDDFVSVFNLNDLSHVANISVPEGPERIVTHQNKVWVAHYGGFNFGDKISLINPATNILEESITVGDLPQSMQVVNGDIWVLCSGKPSWSGEESNGSLYRINPSTNTATLVKNYGAGEHPAHLVANNNHFYYSEGSSVYRMPISSTQAESLFDIGAQGVYGIYAMSLHNNHLLVGDAGDFNSNGKVFVYNISGELQTQFTTGIIPAGIYFNN